MRRLSLALVMGLCALVLAAADDSPVASSVNVQGDADCSGAVGSPDALGILGTMASVGDAGCVQSADTNCDGHVDARDALNVLLFLSGGDPNTPAYCDDVGAGLGPVVLAIDEDLEPKKTVESLDGGPAPKVEVVEDASGVRTEFVGDEVIYQAEDDEGLQAFLAAHDGTIIRDDSITPPSAALPAGGQPIETGAFLIRVDPAGSDFSELRDDLQGEGLSGKVVVSSEEAAGALALAVGDQSGKTDLNALGDIDDSWEHPDSPTTFINADSDYNYFGSGSQSLLDTGVADAWSYLRYHDVVQAPQAFPFQATRVAIIDQGFALASSGLPLGGNPDFFPAGGVPAQYDVVDDDYRAGGYKSDCADDFGTDLQQCRWHGTGSFGICCSITNNYYGGAGTASNFIVPILIRTDDRISSWSEGIWAAIALEADVMNISMSTGCDWFCGWFDGDIGDATDHAGTHGSIIVASAGNKGSGGVPYNIGGDERRRPCEFPKVVCVGAMTLGKMNSRNWGQPVDIWAPEDLRTTVAPDDPTPDDNDFGRDELMAMDGTSAASPYVAGIVALMKSLRPTLTYSQALMILADTSNPANDPKITKGYVNALQAVLETKPNVPPTILAIPRPEQGATYGYTGSLPFRVEFNDPEPGADLLEFEDERVAVFATEQGDILCQTSVVILRAGVPGFECVPNFAPLGTFHVNVTVIDPFGGEDTVLVKDVTFVNTPPIVEVIEPVDGSTFYETQSIEFGAYVFDPEEPIPFPQSQIVWESDIDGVIGTGSTFEENLTQGDHTITVTATDAKNTSTVVTFSLHVLSGAGVPIVTITSPAENPYFWGPTPVMLAGNATDPEDGNLTGASLEWYSNIDGFLGTGNQITVTLSGGSSCADYRDHTVSLRATDSDNHVVSDETHVVVALLC